MMQCQLCNDLDGPWELIDYNNRVVLACEKCAKKESKKRKKERTEWLEGYPKKRRDKK